LLFDAGGDVKLSAGDIEAIVTRRITTFSSQREVPFGTVRELVQQKN
jgi:hypothetical protein